MPAKVAQEDRSEGYKEQTALTNGLNTRHRQLMRELASGATIAQAAARTHFSIGRVRQLKSSELFAMELSKMEDEIDQKAEDQIADTQTVSSKMKEASQKAADTLISAATTGDMNSLRVSSAKDLLDRTGYKSPEEAIVDIGIDAGEGLTHAIDTYIKEQRSDAE